MTRRSGITPRCHRSAVCLPRLFFQNVPLTNTSARRCLINSVPRRHLPAPPVSQRAEYLEFLQSKLLHNTIHNTQCCNNCACKTHFFSPFFPKRSQAVCFQACDTHAVPQRPFYLWHNTEEELEARLSSTVCPLSHPQQGLLEKLTIWPPRTFLPSRRKHKKQIKSQLLFTINF